MRKSYDSQSTGHPGRGHVIALLSRTYIWLNIEDDIEAYVKAGLVCQQDKVEKILDHRTVGQNKKSRRIEYLVQRKREPDSEASWEETTL